MYMSIYVYMTVRVYICECLFPYKHKLYALYSSAVASQIIFKDNYQNLGDY